MLDRLVEYGWLTFYWEDNPEQLGPRKKFYLLSDYGRIESGRLLAQKQNSKISDKHAQVI